MTANRLITIPFSHYCEKARWSLDACRIPFTEDGHLPMLHYLPLRRAGGQRTVPLLVCKGGQRYADSTQIAAWADSHRPGTLLPMVASERDEALQLEDEFDRKLGPPTRRWMYFQILPRRDLDHLLAHGVQRWEMLLFRATRPVVVRLMARSLKVDAEHADKDRTRIDAVFMRVAQLLADGRRYLVGDRFTIADLTFASLASPVLLPPQLPAALPTTDVFEGATRSQLETWRASPAGQFALRLYASERAS
ncbi:MAG TPA: glutathione S-transferase family protein [Kofleriaceae bacterium]|jgi:glutathione S-transferase